MKKRVRAIIIEDDKVLTIKRHLPNMVYWVFPGGGVELRDKNDENALKRECLEEANIKIKVLKMIWQRNFQGQIEKFYLCKIVSGKPSEGNGPEYDKNNKRYLGIHKVSWVKLKNINNYYLKPEEIKYLLAGIYKKGLAATDGFSNCCDKINGVLPGFSKNIFYKIDNKDDIRKEIKGYYAIKKYFPAPKLLQTFEYKNIGIIFSEFEKTIGKNKGLIADYLSLGEVKFLRKYEKILSIFRKTFLGTLKKIKRSANNYFFKDRIISRIEKYYDSNLWLKFENKVVNFNGRKLKLTPLKIIKDLRKFYKKNINSWGVISQGDPLSLNIGTRPVFLDFRVAGYNYLMSEFASMYWSNLALDDYFAIIYHPISYKNHEAALRGLNKLVFLKNKIFYKPSPIRIKMTINYIKGVITPCLNKIKKKDGDYDWYFEFKNFIAMRILSIFNLKKMRKVDQLLTLCYLQMFFEINPKSPEDLNKLIFAGKNK